MADARHRDHVVQLLRRTTFAAEKVDGIARLQPHGDFSRLRFAAVGDDRIHGF